MFEIDTARPVRQFMYVARGLQVSVDISVRQCVLMSAALLLCPSVRFVCPFIDQLIDQ